MPRSTREWAQRKLKMSTENINWCGFHINEVIEKYQKDHPEIAEKLVCMLEMLSITEAYIVDISKSF